MAGFKLEAVYLQNPSLLTPSMPNWTVIETHPTHGRTFRRPLDPPESAFVLFGHQNGDGDILHHVELRLLNASRDAYLFSKANIVKAWLSTKRRFPLAGATVQVLPYTSVGPCRLDVANSRTEGGGSGGDSFPTFSPELHFVVREHDLVVLHPNEIVFGQVACAEEVPQRMAAIWDAPRPLSDELLVQLYVFRETDSQRTDVLHMMTLMSHCVTDGMSCRTLMGCLLDVLARGGQPKPAQVPLEERLAMAIPSADLVPMDLRSLSPARRRWRMAVGAVIVQLRMENNRGGYTLPCRPARTTSRSSFVSTLLTQQQTTAVLVNCRLHQLTFGNAYLPLAQVAMTRVLYRRYLRGEISEEEWAYRKRQPYRISGPFNLRPYLDKLWYKGGGGGELKFCVSTYNYQLPFMTLGRAAHQYREHELLDGAPPFSDLLTFDRFLYRAGLVKKQSNAFFSHPLFFEIIRAQGLRFARLALEWSKRSETVTNGSDMHGNANKEDKDLPFTSMPAVLAHDWTTMGNMDLTLPADYPLPYTHPLSPFSPVSHPCRAGYVSPPSTTEVDATPRIVVENATSRIHVSPRKLNLSALTSRGRLEMRCFYDGYVYEDGLVREWLDEVREAVLWYLGQTHH